MNGAPLVAAHEKTYLSKDRRTGDKVLHIFN